MVLIIPIQFNITNLNNKAEGAAQHVAGRKKEQDLMSGIDAWLLGARPLFCRRAFGRALAGDISPIMSGNGPGFGEEDGRKGGQESALAFYFSQMTLLSWEYQAREFGIKMPSWFP